jgi:hypothetical protein
LDDIGLQEVAEMTRHHDLWQAVPIKQGLWRSLFGAPPARSTSSAILGVDLQEFKNAAEACEEVCCTANSIALTAAATAAATAESYGDSPCSRALNCYMQHCLVRTRYCYPFMSM